MLLLLSIIAQAAPYAVVVDALSDTRLALAEQYSDADASQRHLLREQGREAVLTAFDQHILPAWYGTDWDFYGTSTVPKQGKIACGYLVSTTLLHSGFDVERVRLAQQASEHIILTFVDGERVTRFRDRPLSEVLTHLRDEGDGLYIVGLDHHVGYLRQHGEETRFCHSSYLGEAKVICEPAETAPALSSRYRVVGKLLDDAMMEGWLAGTAFETVGPMRD